MTDTDTRTPAVELAAPSLGRLEEQALLEVIKSGWLTMGDRVRRFETEFAALHGVPNAVAVSSATAALQLGLSVFDIGPGDEVLVPSLSFVATASVVVHSGATPVFVDIEDVRIPHMSLVDARRCIGPHTRAILVMHYGGYQVDIPAWRALADEFGLLLFEDAAHAAGLTGGAGGGCSDLAAFSFFANKNMTTAEGGMLVIADADRSERARLLRSHGMTSGTLDRARGRATGYDVVECGHNFRMDELRAALGLVQLERLPMWNEARRMLTAHYRMRVADRLSVLTIPFDRDHTTVGHLLPVVLPLGCDRSGVMSVLRACGVQSSVHYPPIHRFRAFREKFGDLHLPKTDTFSAREVTLPLHPGMETADVDRVVEAMVEAVGATGDDRRA